MKQIEISRATHEDAVEILSLQKLAYQSEAQIYNDWTIPPLLQTAEEIKDEFNTHVFLKAEVKIIHRDAARFELFTGSQSAGNLHLYHKLGYKEFKREPLNSQVELVYLEKIAVDRQR
jgi:hypothetical protein